MIRSTIPRIQTSVLSRRYSSTLLSKSLSSSISSSAYASSYSTHSPTCSQNRYNNFINTPQISTGWARQFSSEEQGKEKKKKDLGETIKRLKEESSSSGDDKDQTNESSSTEETDPRIEKLTSMGTSFLDTLSQTWDDLIASGQAKDINKKIGTPTNEGGDGDQPNYADDDDAANKYEEYKGSKDIMLIDPEEHLSAWERMERRLRDAPIISDILEKSNAAYEKSGAKIHVQETQQKIQHIKEDAEEAWETSQNPWVYRASSVYDTLTAEHEFATAARQLQVLDPDFTIENWKRDVVEHTLPTIMKAFLEGRIQELKPWLGEAVYNRLAAEVRARKKEGVQMDTNVLAIMNAEILACEVEGASVNVERGDDPIILLHFMCQQIHCVRKKNIKKGSEEDGEGDDDKDMDNKDNAEGGKEGEDVGQDNTGSDGSHGRTYMDEELGDVVEGSEDDIRANSYVVAFQREYNEEKMELNWKIVDFRFNGAIAYL